MLATVSQLSMVRPPLLAETAPTGSDARPLPWGEGWVDHPGIGATVSVVNAIYGEAEAGWPTRQCDLFDDFTEADGHLRNAFEQREQEVAGKPWAVQASGADPDDQLAARLIDFALRRLNLVEAIKHLLTFNRYGFAAIEIDWGLVEFEGKLYTLPVHLALVPSRRFRIDTVTDELRLIVDINADPKPLRPDKWLIARRAPTRVVRSGLMRTATWPALWKRMGTRDWVITANRHGVPLPHVTYAGNADQATKDAAKNVVKKFGTDGGAATSEDVKIEVHQAGATSVDMVARLIDHCNRENSKLIIGSTLTNDNNDGGGGSYAMADVHVGTKWGNVLFDAEVIQDTIGFGLIEPICRFNGLRARCPLQIQVVRDLNPKDMVEAGKAATELGIPIPISQFRQVTGWRAPATDADKAPGSGAKAKGPLAPRKLGDPAPEPPPAPEPEVRDEAEPDDDADDDQGEPDKAPAPPKAKPAATGEAKLFQYHLPFMTVRELRARLGFTEPFDGDDENAAEWANKFAPAGAPAAEEAPAP